MVGPIVSDSAAYKVVLACLDLSLGQFLVLLEEIHARDSESLPVLPPAITIKLQVSQSQTTHT